MRGRDLREVIRLRRVSEPAHQAEAFLGVPDDAPDPWAGAKVRVELRGLGVHLLEHRGAQEEEEVRMICTFLVDWEISGLLRWAE